MVPSILAARFRVTTAINTDDVKTCYNKKKTVVVGYVCKTFAIMKGRPKPAGKWNEIL